MNEQEAINTLWGKPYIVPVKDYETAKNMAIKALEKQMPKKIVVQHVPKTSWTREVTKYECPCCNRFLDFSGLNYCPNCGQKLDWK